MQTVSDTRRYYDILDILCCRCQYLRRGGGIRNHPSQGPMSPRQSRKDEIQPDEPHPPILRNTSWAQLGFACASTTSCPRSVCWMCLTMATRAHSGSWSSVLRTGVVTTSWAKQGSACASNARCLLLVQATCWTINLTMSSGRARSCSGMMRWTRVDRAPITASWQKHQQQQQQQQ